MFILSAKRPLRTLRLVSIYHLLFPVSPKCQEGFQLSLPQVSGLQTSRGGAGLAALLDKLYIVGGLDAQNHDVHRTAEVYDPTIDSWQPMGVINRPRFHTGLISLGGSLYVVGGFDSAVYLSSMERCDPREGSWVEV
jgi:Kelch motif